MSQDLHPGREGKGGREGERKLRANVPWGALLGGGREESASLAALGVATVPRRKQQRLQVAGLSPLREKGARFALPARLGSGGRRESGRAGPQLERPWERPGGSRGRREEGGTAKTAGAFEGPRRHRAEAAVPAGTELRSLLPGQAPSSLLSPCRGRLPLPGRVFPLRLHLSPGPGGLRPDRGDHRHPRAAPRRLPQRLRAMRRRLAGGPDGQVRGRGGQGGARLAVAPRGDRAQR